MHDNSDECPDGHRPKCFIAEVYDLDRDGHYESFCEASIESMEDFKKAYKDITKDGVNMWFYTNGRFFKKDGEWGWKPNSQSF
tara:strand:- start:583 stop:831 length:249 start_codon:yes stop_codon:yes gene_type:complete